MTTLVTRDAATGLRRGPVRWPDGTPPPPFGCRRCGHDPATHGDHTHPWERPTNAQVLARMKARRRARAEERRLAHVYVAFCRAAGIFSGLTSEEPVVCGQMNHDSAGNERLCDLDDDHHEDHDAGDGITWPQEGR